MKNRNEHSHVQDGSGTCSTCIYNIYLNSNRQKLERRNDALEIPNLTNFDMPKCNHSDNLHGSPHDHPMVEKEMTESGSAFAQIARNSYGYRSFRHRSTMLSGSNTRKQIVSPYQNILKTKHRQLMDDKISGPQTSSANDVTVDRSKDTFLAPQEYMILYKNFLKESKNQKKNFN